MTLVSRYVAGLFLRLFSLCIGSFIVIFLVFESLELTRRFSRFHPALRHIAELFLLQVAEAVTMAAPLAVLMATLLTLGSLARNSELTALQGSGLSLGRVTRPIVIIALAISLTVFVTAEFLVPRCAERAKFIEKVLIEKQSPSIFFRQLNIWYREGNWILKARLFDPSTRLLKGITVWEMDQQMRPVTRIDAPQGSPDAVGWRLPSATLRRFTGGAAGAPESRRDLPVSLGLQLDDLKEVGKYADAMGFRELRRYSGKLKQTGFDPSRYLAAMHSRLSFPCASLVMAFLGIPFALRGGRTSGIALGIGASLGIGLAYFILNSLLLSLGQGGIVPPLVAAWSANLLFVASGLWLTLSLNR